MYAFNWMILCSRWRPVTASLSSDSNKIIRIMKENNFKFNETTIIKCDNGAQKRNNYLIKRIVQKDPLLFVDSRMITAIMNYLN